MGTTRSRWLSRRLLLPALGRRLGAEAAAHANTRGAQPAPGRHGGRRRRAIGNTVPRPDTVPDVGDGLIPLPQPLISRSW